MTETPEVVESLQATAQRYEEIRTAVDEREKDELKTIADALHEIETILDRYESRATDRDDLKGYIEFRETLSDALDEIPADIAHSQSFIEANEILTTGITATLSVDDFQRARESLEPVRADSRLLESLQSARKEYRTARHAVERQRRETDARIDELHEIVALGEADLDAPIQDILDPIEAYNEAVRASFSQFLHHSAAREVLELLSTAESYPLVALPTPPERLLSYLETADIGAKPVSRLVELAGFSRSKLEHYVDDPSSFSAAVGTNQRFLSQLSASADSLTISWPPEPARELQWRTRELRSIVGRFADEETVAHIRDVHRFTSRTPDEFDHLRATAVARERLTDTQRTRLESGEIAAEIERLRTELRVLDDCLDTYEPLQ